MASEWQRCFDDNERHWYWFNATTGESQWEEDDAAYHGQGQGQGQGGADVPTVPTVAHRAHPHIPAHWLEREETSESEASSGDEASPRHHRHGRHAAHGSSPSHGPPRGHTDPAELPLPPGAASPAAVERFVPPRRSASKASSLDSLNEEVSSGSEHEEMLPKSRGRARYQRVLDDTACVMCCFSWCFFGHACLCEAPCAVLEGALRAVVHLLGAVGMAITAMLVHLSESPPDAGTGASADPELTEVPISTTCFQQARMWARESVLSLAAAVSFVVPCTTWVVYRGFRADDEEGWSLRPLPTVAGWVDPRRFAVLTWGQGSDASNVIVSDQPDAPAGERSMDSWDGPVLHAPANMYSSCCFDPKKIKFAPVPTDDSGTSQPDEDELETGLEMTAFEDNPLRDSQDSQSSADSFDTAEEAMEGGRGRRRNLSI